MAQRPRRVEGVHDPDHIGVASETACSMLLQSMDSMANHDEVAALRAGNPRPIALLEMHGIESRLQQLPSPLPVSEPSRMSTGEKVALFRRLFRGRTDAYPIRWESKTTGKSGYAPACANEWRAGVCEKPRIKCGDCGNRVLIPLSDAVIYDHLAGAHTVGVYPLLEDDTCYFLAVDFDEAEWRTELLKQWQERLQAGCKPSQPRSLLPSSRAARCWC